MSPFIFESVIERTSRQSVDGGAVLRADIAAIKRGIEPSLETLMRAPVLSGWEVLIGAGAGFLSGRVWGHPSVSNGPVVTSPICAIDIASLAWARTHSRFYRLGMPIWWTECSSIGRHDRTRFEGNHDV